MKKLIAHALIHTTEDNGAQFVDDAVGKQYTCCKTSAGKEPLWGPIPYGKTKKLIITAPLAEWQNAVLIGGPTVEVVAALTRYRVEIWNPDADYEGHSQSPLAYAYTSPAALTGTAATDRLNLYTALVNKVNLYAGNNCVAYGLTVADFTLGTSVGDAATNFIVGEVVTQETSNLTAQVAACVITSGTFASDDAAGKIYLYNHSTYTGWLTTAKKLSAAGTLAAVAGITRGKTNCEVTVTNATTLHYQGMVIVDDSGYFTSHKSRGGINRVSLTAGFATATASVIIAGQYSIGSGTDMLALRPVYEIGNQALIAGRMEFDFPGELPVAGTYYKKYEFVVEGGDEDAIDARKVETEKVFTCWFATTTAGHVTNLETALNTLIAK